MRIPVGYRRTGLCPTFAHPTLQRDGLLLRVPLVGGQLLGDQVECLAQVAGQYGNGIIELTNRANVQLRGLAQDTLASALDTCQAAGLGDAAASLVTISPLAGPAENALRATLVRALSTTNTAHLSRKFAVHVDDTARHTADRPADVLIQLNASDQSATGRECQPVGGTYLLTVRALGTTVCASAEEVAVIARRLAERCIEHGPHARPADVAASEGAPALAAALGATQPWLPTPSARPAQPLQVGLIPWPDLLAEPQPRSDDELATTRALAKRERNDSERLAMEHAHAEGPQSGGDWLATEHLLAEGQPSGGDWLATEHALAEGQPSGGDWLATEHLLAEGQPTGGDWLAMERALAQGQRRGGGGAAGEGCLVVAGARFGRVSARTLAGIGALMRQRRLAWLRVTPWRSFVLPCSTTAQAAEVLAQLKALGLLTDARDPAVGVITCIGSAGCWQTELDTLAEAERFVANRPAASAPGALVHVSGCDKRCATRAPVTLTLLGRTDQSGFDTLHSRRP